MGTLGAMIFNTAAYKPYLSSLTAALQGSTDIAGGLVLTNVIQLKNSAGNVTAGISGLTENNAFLWSGGTWLQAIEAGENPDASTDLVSLIRQDGSGFFAKQKMKWDTAGGFKVGIFEVTDDSVVVMGNGSKIVISKLNSNELKEYDNSEHINIDSTTQLWEKTSGSGEYTGGVSIGNVNFPLSTDAEHKVFAVITMRIYEATASKITTPKPENTTISLTSWRMVVFSGNSLVASTGTISSVQTIKSQNQA